MSKRTNYPEYAELITNCGSQDGAAITSSQSEIPGVGDNNGSGPSNEARGVWGSNPRPRTNTSSDQNRTKIPFKATYAPTHLTHSICQGIELRPYMRVLEPSAGAGRMVAVIEKYSPHVTAVELSGDLYKDLSANAHLMTQCYRGDFLRMDPDELGKFDRIVMCPPKQSVAHIQHALKFLRSDGRLIALVQDKNMDDSPWDMIPTPDQFEYDGKIIPCSFVLCEGKDSHA